MTTIPLGVYLWKRIHEVGVRSIVGLPGDFNLKTLDYIYQVDGLRWVGTANELNAAYAADGYARAKDGFGCVVTTHGVGELSALNGIAGAMTEQVKVIHVVGQTTRGMQRMRKLIHHSIGMDPDHQIFNRASREFRVAAAELQDVKDAPAEIDRVIRECWLKSCPVYIFIPLDMVDDHVQASLLDTPIDLSMPSDKEATEKAAAEVLEAIQAAKNPLIFVDCIVQRHNAVKELRELCETLKFPIYSSYMAKGVIDDENPLYAGIYNGKVSAPGVQAAFESADLVLMFGNLPSDTNTGAFTRKIECPLFEFNSDHVITPGGNRHDKVHYTTFLPHLTSKISSQKLAQVEIPKFPAPPPPEDQSSNDIRQSYMWEKLNDFFQPGDVIFGETGTAALGLPGSTFKKNTLFIAQNYYGSIGYCTAAALGADLALDDIAKTTGKPRRRTVLATGDGSIQLTMGELGTMIHYGLKPVILLLNNNGYTIERVIHGAKQPYNDVVPYNFSFALQLFGMPEKEAKEAYHRCADKKDFERVIGLESLKSPQRTQLIEIMCDAFDSPWRLSAQIGLRGEASKQAIKDAGFYYREMPA